MNCREVMELIQRYLDRDLSAAEEAKMRRHMDQCPECIEMYERLCRLSAELEQLPKVVPAFSLVDAIMPKLEEIDRVRAQEQSLAGGDHSGMGSLPGRSFRKFRGKWSWAAASGVVAAGIVFSLFMTTGDINESRVADNSSLSYSSAQSGAKSMESGAMESAKNEAAAPAADSGMAAANNVGDAGAAAASGGEVERSSGNMAPGADAAKAKQDERQLASRDAAPAASDAAAPDIAEPVAPAASPEEKAKASQHGIAALPKAAEPAGEPDASGGRQAPALAPREPMMGITAMDQAGNPTTDTDANSAANSTTDPTADSTANPTLNSAPDAVKKPSGAQLPSPDGAYIAAIENGKVTIRKNGEIVYQSVREWKEAARISFVKWEGETRLYYDVEDGVGVQGFVIDLEKKTEISFDK